MDNRRKISDSEDAMGPGSVDVGLLPKTPEMAGKAISLGHPSLELSIVPASR